MHDGPNHMGGMENCMQRIGSWHKKHFSSARRMSTEKHFPARLALIAWFALLISTVSATPLALASQTGDALFKDDPTVPWHITADEIQHDQKSGRYIAKGNVVITKLDRKLMADYVLFDDKAMHASASGHAIMAVGKDILSGRRIEIDLNNETGTVSDGTLFLDENHFYISGDTIQKTGKNTYTADRATVSACDGKAPAWKISGRKLSITIEGYGTISHATLWAKRIPVLYTPYLFFPVKLKRQSGFLPPQFSFSDRKGAEYIQPYFQVISDSQDATFYLHHMQQRGEKIGVEYRYISTELSKGTVMADALNDRKIDDGTSDSSDRWGYEDDLLLRPNADRYWFRMKADRELPFNFSAKLDLDIVSDQDYLTEFKSGYTGFDETQFAFLDAYGRALDDYNDSTRVNRLNLNRIWPSFSLNAEARWTDDVVVRRQMETDTTLQELPYIGFTASKQPLLKSPFYADLNSTYVHFYRQSGIRGQRADIYPRLYLPYRFKNYVNIEPSTGLRGTAWYIDETDSAAQGGDRTLSRGIYDLKLDVSSDLYQIFSLESNRFDRIKHALRPQIVYEYLPEQDQSEYPSFDASDRIAARNVITYSIVNTFTARSSGTTRQDSTAGDNQPASPPAYTYQQFSRLKLEQSYDINKATDDAPEPFSPILAELDLYAGRYLTLQADAAWSPYENSFTSRNVAAVMSDSRGDRLFVEHRYAREVSESIYADLQIQITDVLSAYSDYERDVFDGKKIESSIGVLYKAQCWSLTVRYRDEQSDRKFEFIVSLHGLGDIGTGVSGRTLGSPFD